MTPTPEKKEKLTQKSIAKNKQKQKRIDQAWGLKDKGVSTFEISRIMGISESTVRTLLAPGEKDKLDPCSEFGIPENGLS